jgi:hypothetical protein
MERNRIAAAGRSDRIRDVRLVPKNQIVTTVSFPSSREKLT